jgi:hypothetical protein
MPKKIGEVDRSVLINAPLPLATNTYTVISHEYVIDTIEKALEDNGFTIKDEVYKCTADAKVAHGAFIINYQEDSDIELMYSFNNSYDKSLRFRAAIGAYVPANEGFIISEMDNWRRKHTGTADNETEDLIKEHIANAKDYFSQLKSNKDAMKEIVIDKQTYGSILGQLYMNEYMSIDQMSLAAKEYNNPSFKYSTDKNNLWTCYCHIIGALRQSHPSKWMQNQVATHLFFVAKYNLLQFDEPETTDENVTTDTYAVQESIQESEEVLDTDENDNFVLPGFAPEVKTYPAAPCVAHDSETAEVDSYETLEEDEISEDDITEQLYGVNNHDVEATFSVTKSVDLDAEEDEEWEQLEVQGVITPIEIKAEEELEEKLIEEIKENCFQAHFFTEDYPGVDIGDTFEAVEGEFYEVVDIVSSDDGNLLVCNPVYDIYTESEDEIKVEDVVENIIEDTVEDTVEEEEHVDESSLEDESPFKDEPQENNFNVDEPEDDGNDTSAFDGNPAVIKAIENELEEIYGYKTAFTYTEIDGQYNIVMESGETIVLSTAYIKSTIE